MQASQNPQGTAAQPLAPPQPPGGGQAAFAQPPPPPPQFQHQSSQGGNNNNNNMANATYGAAPQQPQQPQQAQQPQPQQQQQAQQPPPLQQQQQQQMQQQQAAYGPHQGLNGGWQSDKDYQERRKMIGKIVLLLQQRKPNAPQEWLKKLPQMAKRLEESLYRSAKSFDEYNDVNTLKHRLQQLAVNIGMKTKKIQQAQILQHQQKLQQQVQQQKQAQQQANQQQQQFAQQQTAAPAQPPQQILPAQPAAASAAPPAQRMVNMSDINPMMGAPAPAAPQQQQQPPVQQVQYTQQQQQPPPPPQPPQQQQQSQQAASKAQAPAAPAAAARAPGVPPPATGNGARQVSDRQQVLRHQQQRLLLLRHAAKCQHEDGRCPVTPHCAGMKRLWKHIAECKNQKCLVPHCVSSRYVLSHYHRCKDVRCPVCGPVREAIHRSHEKQKHMQALKQRHQQAVQQTQAGQGAKVPPVAPSTGSATAPVASVPATISASSEPPNKRRKTSLPGQTRPLVQPAAVAGGVPSSITAPQAARMVRPGMPVPGVVGPAGQRPGVPGKPAVAAVPGLAFSNGQVIMPKTTGPKPQEDHTLINCFSVEQIELHIASLNNGLVLHPLKLKTKALEVLRKLQSHQHGWVFNTPVDPVELGLPDYFQVIKHPMDLGSVRKKVENGVYHKLEEFEAHVRLTFDNAMLYNPEGSVVYNMANEMKILFESDYDKLVAQLNAEEDIKRRNGEACLLCGCEKLLFEPPVFYCNGMNCPQKRIRRNSYYYVAGNNQYHWCHQCFQEIRDNITLDLGDLSIKKEALVKKKNDEVHEESWVQCDRCERWVHQICALFNTRQNKDQRSEYACPRCTVDERKKRGNTEATSSTPMAEDLPRTKLSEYLENHVRLKVDEFVNKNAHEKSSKEGIPFEEAKKQLQMGGAITIRQVTSMDRKLEVRERMKKRYAFKNYPDEFNFRCKCIIVFQNLDGVDVILFGLYVYEHDENNPSPNTRAVYVSYLDSVHYMRPRKMRTFIYHEIMISYLDYVRRRGFSTAHIWACPPLKGDDYILYAKPEDQKVPKDDRLRQWYIEMLLDCQRRGIVGKLTNMYDLYFSDPKYDAAAVPYMDGDYFPAEVENIIKDIEDGKAGKKLGSKSKGKNKDKKAKQKKKTGRAGTRSAGLDEEAFKASGVLPPGADPKSLQDGARDFVMAKLGETIQPMKESFIVAYLAWNEAKPENMVVPKEIQDYREKHGITWKLPDNPGETLLPSYYRNVMQGAQKEEKKVGDNKVTDAMDVDKNNDTQAPSEPEKQDSSQAVSQAEPMDVDPKTNATVKPPETKEASQSSQQPNDTKPAEIQKEPAAGAQSSEGTKPPDSTSANPIAAKDNPQGGTTEATSTGGEANPVKKEDGDADKANQPDAPKAAVPNGDKGEEKKDSNSPLSAEPPAVQAPVVADAAAANNTTTNPSSDTQPEAPKPTLEAPESAPEAPKSTTEAPKSTSEAPKSATEVPKSTTEAPQSAPEAPKSAIEAPNSATEAPKSDAHAKDSEKTDAEKKPEESKTQNVNMVIREGKFAAMARKRNVDGELKEEVETSKKADSKEKKVKQEKAPKPEKKAITVVDSKGQTVKVLDDDDEELDCEFLNNRQAFLNLCQGNHYQFDQIRRAKHSSMMVLWHLHNRDAPKFVQQCATCSREILAGYRFHCPTCADFDQCQECYQNPKVARHPHQLKPMPVANGQQTELTEAQRKERQRSIQLHMTLLMHAATCNSPKCPSANCTKMKGLLKHGAQCQVKATGGCNVCKRIWALLQIHARQCKAKTCPVPNCMAIRERVRQLKKQQQAMDDRRRQEMNRAYRGKR